MIRYLWALLVAVLVLGVARPAGAVPVEKNAELGEAPAPVAPKAGVPLVSPHDVPIRAPTARGEIPPVPPSYITRNLGWLELAYPPSAAERVASLVRDADAVKAELEAQLGQKVLEHVTVRVAPTFADMARLAPADAPPPDYASGVAYNGLHLVLLTMLQPRGAEAVDLDEVFRHELAHVALEDAVQGRHVPVWFNEGLAIALSGELEWPRRETLGRATLSGTLIPLADLDRSFPRDNFEVSIAYAEAADFMRFLTRKSDRLRFAAVIDRVREDQTFERAIAEAYGSELRRLEFEWHADLERRFSIIPVLTGGGLLWVLVMGGFVYVYVRKKRRAQAILARWAREEAMEDARLALRATEESDAAVVNAARTAAAAASVKIEHAGRWHTLH